MFTYEFCDYPHWKRIVAVKLQSVYFMAFFPYSHSKRNGRIQSDLSSMISSCFILKTGNHSISPKIKLFPFRDCLKGKFPI